MSEHFDVRAIADMVDDLLTSQELHVFKTEICSAMRKTYCHQNMDISFSFFSPSMGTFRCWVELENSLKLIIVFEYGNPSE